MHILFSAKRETAMPAIYKYFLLPPGGVVTNDDNFYTDIFASFRRLYIKIDS
jgi:hypothetical protein